MTQEYFSVSKNFPNYNKKFVDFSVSLSFGANGVSVIEYISFTDIASRSTLYRCVG